MPKFNVKTTDKKTIEVEGKLVKSPPSSQPPKWFAAFQKEQKEFNKNIIERFDNLENRFDNLENRFDNLVSKNNLQE